MVAEALFVKSAPDIIFIPIAFTSIEFVPITDHTGVTNSDIIKIQSAKSLIFSAVFLPQLIVHNFKYLINIFVADLDDIRHCPFGRIGVKERFNMLLPNVTVVVS